MEFVDKLLGGGGCSADGTTTRNPIANMADSLFDSLAINQQPIGMDASSNMIHSDELLLESHMEQRNYQSMVNQFQQTNLGLAPPQASMNSHSSPQFGQYDPYMEHMQMQQMMMMQHQSMMQQSMMQQTMFQQQQYQQDHAALVEEQRHMEEARRLEQEALAFKVYDDILNGNGTSYEALKSMSVEDQNLLLGGLYQSKAQVTSQGNEQAWQNIAYHLETKMREYIYKENNPYDADKSESLFNRGMELFQAGNIPEAILVFEADVKQHPEAADTWRMLGVCHCELDNDKVAIECFKRAVDIDPYNTDALRDLGTSYVNELNSIKALETLRAWVTHNPRFVGLDIKTDVHSDGSLMDEVLHLMMEAEAFAPNEADVLTVLGVLCNVSMDFEYAIDCFERAITLRPTDYTLLNKLGATLANANQSPRAIPIYAKALELRPQYARGWLNLGISYSNVSQNKEAAMAYLQALRLSPDAKHIWGYLRTVLSNLNRLDLVEMSGRERIEELSEAVNKL